MSTYWTGLGGCWLAQFSDSECGGRLQKAHLIPQQLIRREVLQIAAPPKRRRAYERDEVTTVLWDSRVWVPACEQHHHALDQSRRLKVPRRALPAGVEEYASEHRLAWWLDREYGCVEALA